jgi:RNA polymerase sigma factor (sigma-70 family)
VATPPAALAGAAGADREKVFEATVRAESSRLFGLAFTILRDRFEAEDAVQDTMAVAWRSWDQLIDPTRRGPWLTRICVRKAAAQRRGMVRRRFLTWESLPAAALTDAAAVSNPDLDRAYRRLSGHQRSLLALHYHYGYTLDQCADLMGCRPGTARSHLGRALDKLRRDMSDA